MFIHLSAFCPKKKNNLIIQFYGKASQSFYTRKNTFLDIIRHFLFFGDFALRFHSLVIHLS